MSDGKEYLIGERAGKITVGKIGKNITFKLWYSTSDEYTEPHQKISLFPEELDRLYEWWQKSLRKE